MGDHVRAAKSPPFTPRHIEGAQHAPQHRREEWSEPSYFSERERERAFACLPIVKNVVFMCLPVHLTLEKENNSNKQLITGCFLLTHNEGMFKTCSL